MGYILLFICDTCLGWRATQLANLLMNFYCCNSFVVVAIAIEDCHYCCYSYACLLLTSNFKLKNYYAQLNGFYM